MRYLILSLVLLGGCDSVVIDEAPIPPIGYRLVDNSTPVVYSDEYCVSPALLDGYDIAFSSDHVYTSNGSTEFKYVYYTLTGNKCDLVLNPSILHGVNERVYFRAMMHFNNLLYTSFPPNYRYL